MNIQVERNGSSIKIKCNGHHQMCRKSLTSLRKIDHTLGTMNFRSKA